MSYSYPRIIIDLICTDARETNCPSLPFTDTSDGNYLVNPGDADAGYINEQWWIENLTPNAEYQYVLYSCQIKTDHHYSVDVEVTGTYTNQHTYTQSTTTFPVVKDVMEADSNGKIYFSLPNAGLYGAGLSWIRISS